MGGYVTLPNKETVTMKTCVVLQAQANGKHHELIQEKSIMQYQVKLVRVQKEGRRPVKFPTRRETMHEQNRILEQGEQAHLETVLGHETFDK